MVGASRDGAWRSLADGGDVVGVGGDAGELMNIADVLTDDAAEFFSEQDAQN